MISVGFNSSGRYGYSDAYLANSFQTAVPLDLLIHDVRSSRKLEVMFAPQTDLFCRFNHVSEDVACGMCRSIALNGAVSLKDCCKSLYLVNG